MTKPRAAEKRLASLFSEKGCIATDPDEDIHGWDLFIEFPRAAYNGPAEDQPPISKAYLQVKSTTGKSNTASIKLSNVQIAITSHDPWLFVRAYPDKTYRIVHIWGEILFKWIKAIRKASLAGKALHLNMLSLRFAGPKFTEDELVDAVSSAITKTEEPYAIRKRKLIEELRYRDGAATGKFTLTASSQHQLAMILLGVDRRVLATDVHFTKTTFGVPDNAHTDPPSDALITIEPKPIASCQIRFTNAAGVGFLSTFGEVRSYKPYNARLGETYFRFSAPNIEIVKRPDGLIFSRLGAEKQASLTFAMLEQWAIVGTELEKGSINVSVSENGPKAFLKTTISKKEQAGPAYRSLATLVRLMQSSGNRDAKYTTEQIEEALPDLYLLSQILSKGSIKADFEFINESKRLDRVAYWFDIRIGADIYYSFIDHDIKRQNNDNNRHTVFLTVTEFPEIYVHREGDTYNRENIEKQFDEIHSEAKTDAEVVSFGNILDRLKEPVQLDA